MMRGRFSLLLPFLAAVCAASVPAQTPVWEAVGTPCRDYRLSGSFIDDITGDGVPDVVTRASDGCSAISNYRIVFLDGATGAIIRELIDPVLHPGRPFQNGLRGDFSGDGFGDYTLLLRWPTMSRLEIRSGVDDSVIVQRLVPPGIVIGAGGRTAIWDADGDGQQDLLIGDFAQSGSMQGDTLRMWRRDGSHVFVEPLVPPPGGGATSVVPYEDDYDGDGVPDFIVGWFFSATNLEIFSGATGLRVHSFPPDPAYPEVYVAMPVSDLDGDGRNDIFAVTLGGSVVYGTATDSVIRTFPNNVVGTLIAGTPDLDRDGRRDILGGGRVSFNLEDGTGFGVYWPAGGNMFPVDAATFPGEPFPRILCAESSSTHGRIALYAAEPDDVQLFGTACSVNGAEIPRMGYQRRDHEVPGVTGRVHLSNVDGATRAFLVVGGSNQSWGGSALPLPLDPFGVPGCELAVSVDLIAVVNTDASGRASLELPHPPVYVPGLDRLYAQWILIGNRGRRAVSEGIEWDPYR